MVSKVTNKDVQDSILNNDIARATQILEDFELTKDGTPPHFTSSDRDVVTIMLSTASAMAQPNLLEDELVYELIERTAMTVDIFPFLRLINTATNITCSTYDGIPKRLLSALKKNDYSDRSARDIESLDDGIFRQLIALMLSGEIGSSHVKFNLPFIRYIHEHQIVDDCLLFAYMGLCQRDAVDTRMRDALDHALFGALFGGMADFMRGGHEDDEDTQHGDDGPEDDADDPDGDPE